MEIVIGMKPAEDAALDYRVSCRRNFRLRHCVFLLRSGLKILAKTQGRHDVEDFL
jgi:hypothetical protein